MADPLTLALTLGPPILSKLFGGGDKGPDYQQKLYEWLMNEIQTGKFGLSPQEQAAMLDQIGGQLREQSQQRTGSSLASLGRRGFSSAGQTAGVTTEIGAGFGKGFAKAATDIPLYSAEIGRKQKQSLYNMLPGVAGGASSEQFANRAYGDQGYAGMTGSLADFLQSYKLTEFFEDLNKRWMDNQGQGQGSVSGLKAPSMWNQQNQPWGG